MILDAQIEVWFKGRPITAEQIERITVLDTAAMEFTKVLVRVSPPSADQTAAVRKIREATWTATAAIMQEVHEEEGH